MLRNADQIDAIALLDPRLDRVDRVAHRIGRGVGVAGKTREPLEVALGRKDGAGGAGIDAGQERGGTGPFGGGAFARLRQRVPVAGRGFDEEE